MSYVRIATLNSPVMNLKKSMLLEDYLFLKALSTNSGTYTLIHVIHAIRLKANWKMIFLQYQ